MALTRRLTTIGGDIETQLGRWRRLTTLGGEVETQLGRWQRLAVIGVMIETVGEPYPAGYLLTNPIKTSPLPRM